MNSTADIPMEPLMKLYEGNIDEALIGGAITEAEAVEMYYWVTGPVSLNDPRPPKALQDVIARINLFNYQGSLQ
jgi:hypothetical protein